MERLEILLDWVDLVLDSKKKRHAAGGILISVSLFFGGLAITIITIDKEDSKKKYE